METKLYKSLLFLFALAFFSCGNNSDRSEEMYEEEVTSSSVDTHENAFDVQKVFSTLPNRKLVLGLIEENQIQYNPDILNDPTAMDKYSVEFFKAINLGIYGSDLNIASAFNQAQESMVFLKCVNRLADNLGVGGAFNQSVFDRIDENKNNKDSISEIVSNAFKKVDEILKSNHRPATAATILAGCWIEGLYVSCYIATELNSESIIRAILEQKESLRNLLGMLESAQLSDSSKFVLGDLKNLYEEFEKINVNAKSYDAKSILGITKRIADLRTKVVNSDSTSAVKTS